MLELALIFCGGLLGSAHCVGMCGGFVLTLGSRARSWKHNAGRQVIYALGRIFTYMVMGALAGFGGWKLGREAGVFMNAQAVLSILAGVMLIGEGLLSTGLIRRPWSTAHACPGASGFASLLRAGHPSSVFAGGVVNGLLPCGLVYAYLMLAASASSIAQGALVMATFGLGTLPLLLFTGVGGGLLALPARRRLFHVAAWCMIATGGLTLVRGAVFLGATPGDSSACPLCAENASGLE